MKFLSKNRLFFVSCLIIAVSILFSYSSHTSSYGYIEKKIIDFIAPIEKASSSALYSFSTFSNRVANFFVAFKENKQLKERNAFLEHYFYLYHQVEAENKQLRLELNFTKSLEHEYITAQVISRNNSAIRQQLTIGVGSKDGISKGQIALFHNQLVGRVVRLSENTATILLLSDQDSRIPVISINSKTKCIAAGLSTSYFSCKYLDDHAKLEEGELVVTSGDNTAIIAGIIVGSIFKKDNYFYIKPTIDFNKIEFIHIMQP